MNLQGNRLSNGLPEITLQTVCQESPCMSLQGINLNGQGITQLMVCQESPNKWFARNHPTNDFRHE